MATIQVREIPDDLYDVLRRRARRAGQSLQAYMREQVVALAERPSKEEAIARVEAALARSTGQQIGTDSVLGDLDAERR